MVSTPHTTGTRAHTVDLQQLVLLGVEDLLRVDVRDAAVVLPVHLALVDELVVDLLGGVFGGVGQSVGSEPRNSDTPERTNKTQCTCSKKPKTSCCKSTLRARMRFMNLLMAMPPSAPLAPLLRPPPVGRPPPLMALMKGTARSNRL